MKKIYNAPSVEVVKINAQNILAGSENVSTGTYDGTQQTLSRGNRGPLDWEEED